MSSLPTYLVHIVLAFLDIKGRIGARATCKSLYHLNNDVPLQMYEFISWATCWKKHMFRHFPSAGFLQLTINTQVLVSEPAMRVFRQLTRRTHKLCIVRVSFLDLYVVWESFRFPNLDTLEMPDTELLVARWDSKFLQCCSRLQNITMKGGSVITLDQIKYLKFLVPSLEHLTFTMASRLPPIVDGVHIHGPRF